MNQRTKAIWLLLCAGPVWAQDWPQWRGPNRDNHVVGFTAPKTWPKDLKQQWKVNVGEGEASPVLAGNKVYVFTRQGDDEVTLCLNADSGKELWRDKYAAEKGRGGRGAHAGPRSTPAVGNGKVCTLGVGGVVSCLDAASGKVIWRIATGSSRTSSTSMSPVIVDGSCIVFVKSLTAYDLASGAIKWEWSGGAAPYGSPVLMTVDGTRQIVTPVVGQRLVGVNLANGKLLWESKVSGRDYGTPITDGNTVFFSAGQSSVAFKIEKNGDAFQAKELWKKSGTATHEYYTPLLKNGLLYGVSHSLRPGFFCLDAKTGRKLWTDDTPRGHCGSILDAGPVLIALTSDQYLVIFQASDKAYMEVAKYQVCDSETWSVPIIAGKRVFVKEKVGSLILWTFE